MDITMYTAMLIIAAGSVMAFVLAACVDISRLSAARLRLTIYRRRLNGQRKKIERTLLDSKETRLAIERTRQLLNSYKVAYRGLVSSLKLLEAEKVELVHEIGSQQRLHSAFRCKVSSTNAIGNISSTNIVFHRDIWKFTNVAVVWALTPEHAREIAISAFGARSGLQVGLLAMATTDVFPAKADQAAA
jgi:hypothetical protein